MTDLVIQYYPENPEMGKQLRVLLERIMEADGINGTVIESYFVTEICRERGITRFPAFSIEDEIVMQGQYPAREDLWDWFDRFVPEFEKPAMPTGAPRARSPAKRKSQIGSRPWCQPIRVKKNTDKDQVPKIPQRVETVTASQMTC